MAINKATLHDFCRNPDGETYDGRKLVQWLFEATTGKEMSAEEAQQIVEQAQAKAAAKRG